mgnify:CR=1 FL=1
MASCGDAQRPDFGQGALAADEGIGHEIGNQPHRMGRVEGQNFGAGADSLADEGVSLFTVGVNGPDYDISLATELCKWRDRRNG